jgi:hypothetical protein
MFATIRSRFDRAMKTVAKRFRIEISWLAKTRTSLTGLKDARQQNNSFVDLSKHLEVGLFVPKGLEKDKTIEWWEGKKVPGFF